MPKLLRILAPLSLAVLLVVPIGAVTRAQAPAVQGGASRPSPSLGAGATQTISARTAGM